MRLYQFASFVQATADSVADDAAIDTLDDDVNRMLAGHRVGQPVINRLRRLRHRCPADGFRHLVAAARQDQLKVSYPDFESLMGYCSLSGGSLGVLGLHALARLPDAHQLDRVATIYASARLLVICASLREDAAGGRVYLPATELGLRGLTVSDVTTRLASVSPAVSEIVAALSARALYLLQAAAPVLRDLPPSARIVLSGVIAESVALHRMLHRAGLDVLRPPSPASRIGASLRFAHTLRTRPSGFARSGASS
jgi:phytoene/squalene synthetase